MKNLLLAIALTLTTESFAVTQAEIQSQAQDSTQLPVTAQELREWGCKDILNLVGYVDRAQTVCNIPRHGKEFAQHAQQCMTAYASKVESFVAEGQKDFDDNLKIVGQPFACSRALSDFPTVLSN